MLISEQVSPYHFVVQDKVNMGYSGIESDQPMFVFIISYLSGDKIELFFYVTKKYTCL